MTSSTHSKPVRLAGLALQHALASRDRQAADVMVRISQECGANGIYLALIMWCDAYYDHAVDGAVNRPRAVGRMKTINAATGELGNPYAADTDVPQEVAWAGALVEARAALDQERFDKILNELPADPHEIAAHVRRLLECVATTINGLPRGFARMRWPTGMEGEWEPRTAD